MWNSDSFGFGGCVRRLAIWAVAISFSVVVLAEAAQPAAPEAKPSVPAKPSAPAASAGASKPASPQPAPAPPTAAKPTPAPASPAPAVEKPPAATPPAGKPPAAEPAEPAPTPAATSFKQEMSGEEYKKAVEKFRRDKSAVQKMLRAQVFAAGQEAQFDAYYNDFALPRWTVPENYPSLTEFRRELRNDFLAAKSGPPYDRLLSLAFDYLTRLAGPGYHPAVRYNAMMAIGELNVQELQPGSRERLQPYPPALKAILDAIKSSDSDAVRVAALLGLQRHASLGIADAQVRDGQIVPMLLDLAKSPPPAGRSPEGHAWLRTMAINILATLHAVGPNGRPVTPNAELVKTLVGIVADKDAPATTRSAAARALGTFDYKGFTALTPSQIAAPIGQMAVEICTAELAKTRSAAAKTPTKSGGRAMGSMMPGSYPMGEGSLPMPGMMPMGGPMYGSAGAQKEVSDEEADRLARLRRALKYYLDGARQGLNGPNDSQNGGLRLYAAKFEPDLKKLSGFQDPDWTFVNGVFGAVQEIIKALDGDEEEYSAVAKKVVAARTKLRDLVSPAAADKGPAPSAPAPPAKN